MKMRRNQKLNTYTLRVRVFRFHIKPILHLLGILWRGEKISGKKKLCRSVVEYPHKSSCSHAVFIQSPTLSMINKNLLKTLTMCEWLLHQYFARMELRHS